MGKVSAFIILQINGIEESESVTFIKLFINWSWNSRRVRCDVIAVVVPVLHCSTTELHYSL